MKNLLCMSIRLSALRSADAIGNLSAYFNIFDIPASEKICP